MPVKTCKWGEPNSLSICLSMNAWRPFFYWISTVGQQCEVIVIGFLKLYSATYKMWTWNSRKLIFPSESSKMALAMGWPVWLHLISTASISLKNADLLQEMPRKRYPIEVDYLIIVDIWLNISNRHHSLLLFSLYDVKECVFEFAIGYLYMKPYSYFLMWSD